MTMVWIDLENLSVDYLRNNFLFNPTDIIDGLASVCFIISSVLS